MSRITAESNKTRIVGILLVKNEEKYIQRVISNVAGFCDSIIVADNLSEDDTAPLILDLVKESSGRITYHSISDPRLSHNLIQEYAGTKTWIFAIDGDEIYDPLGLARLRKKILQDELNAWWMVFGNVLNCTEIDEDRGYARGYLAPPCRSMTKLYNFNLINSWEGPCPERLHGGTIVFKQGYSRKLRMEMYKEVDWEESYFRCLHLCFINRSSLDQRKGEGLYLRKNISDLNSERLHTKIINRVFSSFRRGDAVSEWKREKYMRGRLVEKEISRFVSPL